MGVILVTCPKTGREFSTGIQIDRSSFAAIPDVATHSRCPHCGEEHHWRKGEAKYADAILPADWIENHK